MYIKAKHQPTIVAKPLNGPLLPTRHWGLDSQRAKVYWNVPFRDCTDKPSHNNRPEFMRNVVLKVIKSLQIMVWEVLGVLGKSWGYPGTSLGSKTDKHEKTVLRGTHPGCEGRAESS